MRGVVFWANVGESVIAVIHQGESPVLLVPDADNLFVYPTDMYLKDGNGKEIQAFFAGEDLVSSLSSAIKNGVEVDVPEELVKAAKVLADTREHYERVRLGAIKDFQPHIEALDSMLSKL